MQLPHLAAARDFLFAQHLPANAAAHALHAKFPGELEYEQARDIVMELAVMNAAEREAFDQTLPVSP
jgi:hypothetical protein